MTSSGDLQYSFNRCDIDALQEMASMNLKLLLLTKGRIPALEKIVNGPNMSLKVVEDSAKVRQLAGVGDWEWSEGEEDGRVDEKAK